MLKLARNALCDLEVLKGCDGKYIKWSYIKALHEIQEKEGLKFANKISIKHIYFQRHKMNVKFAAQTLSSSVPNATEFLMFSKHPNFKHVEGTINFIRVINKLFDMLNSKNLFSKSYKKALFLNDYLYWNTTFDQIINYLSKLTDANGTPLLKHRRKTFVLGLIVAAKSLQHLAYELLTLNVHPFKFCLTYKFSQDYIELLFSCICEKNGFNNKPDGTQFKSSLKRILLHNSIVG
ncbi:DNA transposase THAP9-like isoform X2 [Hydra vulgaris]|uniref:DNA transposase THAP9-like isoform X2 n=1 Tax=Hydra vulgaris TaxID=6087 RepID=A0ABM4B217_HYDVU